MRFDKFTIKSQELIQNAQSLASAHNNQQIEPEHLLSTMLMESRIGIFTAVMVGFGRAISEVGAVIIVGGNIKWHTQVLTTAIVLETQSGNFQFALTLGVILIVLALVTSIILTLLQGKYTERKPQKSILKWKNGG